MSSLGKSNRRQFLKGHAAVDAPQNLTRPDELGSRDNTATSDLAGRHDIARGTYLIQIGRRAMACQFEVLLNADPSSDAAELAIQALDLVDALEQQMTVYRDHSEISRINRTAATKAAEVEPRLFELLEHAVQLYLDTAGAFDITAGPLSKLWGFYRREGNVPSRKALARALSHVGTRWLETVKHNRSIRFAKPDMEINLGGIGKGYALDRCAEFFLDAGLDDFLIHGGQSSVLAHGSRANVDSDAPPGWSVGLRHPLRPDQRLAEFRLRDRALGTSGTGTQFFHSKGKRYGHILDPRTGWPAEGVLSSTAITPSAATADALATAFYVMGVEATREYCERHPDVAAVLVVPGSKHGTVDVHGFGLDDGDWQCIDDRS